jgi:hypothetical protein
MDLVPQFAGDHVREVRAQWEAQEAFQMLVPPEAKMLIKDKTLIDRVKGLLAHFNEPLHSTSPELNLMEEESRTNEIKETEDDLHEPEIEEPHFTQSVEKKIYRSMSPSKMFQVLHQL